MPSVINTVPFAKGELPHSEISGSQPVRGSPEHIGAVPRPSSARSARASIVCSSCLPSVAVCGADAPATHDAVAGLLGRQRTRHFSSNASVGKVQRTTRRQKKERAGHLAAPPAEPPGEGARRPAPPRPPHNGREYSKPALVCQIGQMIQGNVHIF